MGETSLPLIDISSLVDGVPGPATVEAIGHACRDDGFFYVVGHGVDADLIAELDSHCRRFFAQPLVEKMKIRMELGGRARRGYFPVGAELTSGEPDQKEGLYFAADLPPDDPRVVAGVPLHGANLAPAILGFRECLDRYLEALTRLGQQLMAGVALSLGLESTYFYDRYTRDPFILFRIFHYPPLPPAATRSRWSVGEHTDYGLLTILRQDDAGGLQVKSKASWLDAPPVPGSFVCNLGDMLERMSAGIYRSTPHRVRNTSSQGRLSFPFFFDPSFAAEVRPIATGRVLEENADERWDRTSVHGFEGAYGDYLLRKVGKVFPDLGDDVL